MTIHGRMWVSSADSTRGGHLLRRCERPFWQRQEPVVADRPTHGWHWPADIWSGFRWWFERPLCAAQLTKRCDWAGTLLEGLLNRRARPISDIHGPKESATLAMSQFWSCKGSKMEAETRGAANPTRAGRGLR